jgi:polyphosphate glucokinase
MQKQKKDILVIDVGGTHIKVFATGQKEAIKIPSGPKMTAKKMVKEVKKATMDWDYSVVSIGYPAPVVHGLPLSEPHNLAGGWVGFDFGKAFGRPLKIVNDAAMQALGIYQGGRMLFLGLGTGLGSAMIVDGILEPMEIAHLPYKKGRTFEDYLGIRGLKRLGKKKWRRYVGRVAEQLKNAMGADYVVLGGGNAKLLKKLPPGTRLGDNASAFTGGPADFNKSPRPSESSYARIQRPRNPSSHPRWPANRGLHCRPQPANPLLERGCGRDYGILAARRRRAVPARPFIDSGRQGKGSRIESGRPHKSCLSGWQTLDDGDLHSAQGRLPGSHRSLNLSHSQYARRGRGSRGEF